MLATAPLSAAQICIQTERNPILSKVKHYEQLGWPVEVGSTPELLPFSRRKDEFSLQDGCILWGTQVIVPTTLCAQVMNKLHEAYQESCATECLVPRPIHTCPIQASSCPAPCPNQLVSLKQTVPYLTISSHHPMSLSATPDLNFPLLITYPLSSQLIGPSLTHPSKPSQHILKKFDPSAYNKDLITAP